MTITTDLPAITPEIKAWLDEVDPVADTSWTDYCLCARLHETDEFFVEAGHTIDPAVLEDSRRCPTRKVEIRFAYKLGLSFGYWGGLSWGQRKKMTLEEALAFVDNDPPAKD